MGSKRDRQNRQPRHFSSFFKSLGGKYKRIRRRCKRKPNAELYQFKIECLKELEKLSETGLIDLFYGDESHVCTEGYVPYGWQFPGEKVCILSEKGHKINCFGLISRDNQCHWATSVESIDALFVREQLEQLSFQIRKQTFIVLDCARVHTSKIIRERLEFWQNRGLFIFYLPPYSPELNLAETLWRKLKKEWLKPEDYSEKDKLFYAANRCLANIGKHLNINFAPFSLN
jgi:transposase